MFDKRTFDVCVVGGGSVGLATARALGDLLPGADLLVLEKEVGVAQHQSSDPSEIEALDELERRGPERDRRRGGHDPHRACRTGDTATASIAIGRHIASTALSTMRP